MQKKAKAKFTFKFNYFQINKENKDNLIFIMKENINNENKNIDTKNSTNNNVDLNKNIDMKFLIQLFNNNEHLSMQEIDFDNYYFFDKHSIDSGSFGIGAIKKQK